jgi:hypothetical protein
VEEEAREAGKTWNEVKRLTANRTRWWSFTDALCSRRSYRNQMKLNEIMNSRVYSSGI